jgi:predicted NBD/HSP70 family sugar kinase
MNNYSLGIDIGASQVRFILADSKNGNLNIGGNNHSKETCLSPSNSKFDIKQFALLKELPDTQIFQSYIVFKTKEYLANSAISIDLIESIGVSVAGRILQGSIFIGSNLPLKYTSHFGIYSGVDLNNPIQSAFPGKKIIIENDATCSGIAQAAYYEYMGIDPLKTYYITISTGIGGGGPKRDLDEVGHIMVGNVYPGLNLQCGCGAIGCVESTTSGTGIKNLTNKILQLFCTDKALFGELNAFEFLRTNHRYTLGGIIEKSRLLKQYQSGKSIEPNTIFDLAREYHTTGKGDEFAYYIIESAAERLAGLFVSLANIHGIERFGIGGSVASKNPFLLELTAKYIQSIRADVNRSFSPDIVVELSPLGEFINDYGALFLTLEDKETRKNWIRYFIENVKGQ